MAERISHFPDHGGDAIALHELRQRELVVGPGPSGAHTGIATGIISICRAIFHWTSKTKLALRNQVIGPGQCNIAAGQPAMNVRYRL
jgi:hypothetical protein